MSSGIAATKCVEFDAAHRVLGHKGKCRHLHGHRYRAEISVARVGGLDDLGMVMDFQDIKDSIGKWIDDNWDHNVILNSEDPLAAVAKDKPLAAKLFGGRKPYILHKQNPTAEVMAEYLRDIVDGMVPTGVQCVQVRLYETPSSYADSVPISVEN